MAIGISKWAFVSTLTLLGISLLAKTLAPISDDSRKAVSNFLAKLGIEVKPGSIKMQKAYAIRGKQVQRFFVSRQDGGTLAIIYSAETGQISVSSDLEFMRQKQPFRSAKPRFASMAAARPVLEQTLRRLALDQPGVLQDVPFSLDRAAGTGQWAHTQVGSAKASYQLLMDGYPQVDGFSGFTLALASSDGAFFSLLGSAVPLTREPKRDELTETQARAKLAKHNPRLPVSTLNVRKGWAFPLDREVAVLVYRFQKSADRKSGGDAIYVESRTNGRIWMDPL